MGSFLLYRSPLPEAGLLLLDLVVIGRQGSLDGLLLGRLDSSQLTDCLDIQGRKLTDGRDVVGLQVLLQEPGPLARGEVVQDSIYTILE